MDDLDLVAGVRAGDDRAFELLFRRYQPRVEAFVGRAVRDHGRAEDITQEVFMSALRRLREDDREILFRPWIYEIAKNKCIDAHRRGRHTTEVSFDAHDQVRAAEYGRLAEPGTTPDAAVEGKLAFDNLRGAFGGLSPVHHEILVMREFEGLSYREIGERLGMSRPAVESTLFRARKRLGEEYEELVSGKRCQRVQRIVGDAGVQAAGLRDQRRLARHLAHCQPCRRYAHLAGCDVGDLVRQAPSLPARVAAFLPLPAFLRRRLNAEEAGQILSQQAARPVAQWSAHVAGTVDPGVVSGWVKVAAAAATVAVAGVGGSAIQHRSNAGSKPAAAEQVRSVERGRAAPGLPLPGTVAANAQPVGGGAPAAAAARSAAGGTGPSQGPHPGSDPASRSDTPSSVDPQRTMGGLPQAPAGSVEDTADRTLAPVVDAVGGATRGSDLPVGAGSDATRGVVETPGRLVGGAVAPVQGATGSAGGAASDVAAGAQGAVDGPVRGVVGGVSDAVNAAPTGAGASVLPSVSQTLTNPTAAPSTLGG